MFSYPTASPVAAALPMPAVKIPGEKPSCALSRIVFLRLQTRHEFPLYPRPERAPTFRPGACTRRRRWSSCLPTLFSTRFVNSLPPVRCLPPEPPHAHIRLGSRPGYFFPFDVEAIRRDFPILQERVHGQPLIWLDNAATTQKPQSVIDRLCTSTSTRTRTSIAPRMSSRRARPTPTRPRAKRCAASSTRARVREIVFVRGTTEAINLVAQSWGRQNIQKDDEIVITWLEHHANIVPWQQLCAEKGARLRVAPVDDRGQVMLDEYREAARPADAPGLVRAGLERARHRHSRRRR